MERSKRQRRVRWLLAAGLLAMAGGSSVLAAPTGVAPIYSKNKFFKLPIQVDDAIRGKIQEIKLFVKGPDGKWNNAATGSPLQGSFSYQADADGEYWFTFVTVDRSGRRTPENLDLTNPHRVVIIDSQAPSLKVEPVKAANGEAFLRCQIVDPNPDPTSIKLSYLSSTGAWIPMEQAYPETPGLFKSPAAVNFRGLVRASAMDRAGNAMNREVDLSKQLNVNPAALTQNNAKPVENDNSAIATISANPMPEKRMKRDVNIPAPMLVPSMDEIEPAPGVAPLPLPNINPIEKVAPTNNAKPEQPFEAPIIPAEMQISRKPAPKPPLLSENSSVQELELTPPVLNEPNGLPLPLQEPEGPILNRPEQPIRPASATDGMPKERTKPKELAVPATLPIETPETSMPKPALINSLRCSLEYTVENVGSGMPARVEFWATLDRGKTWIRLVDEAKGHSPAHLVMPGDGVYGILIRNAGSTQAPSLKDKPDCWVEVDTTRPFVNLLPASVGVGPDYGTLSILWTAYDKNFGSNPISLGYAIKPEGPWVPIVENHPNEGVYRWNLPVEAGNQVYLRLEGKDRAGNISRIETRNPVILEVPKPKAKVLRVGPGNTGN